MTAREVLDGIRGRLAGNIADLAWPETWEEQDSADKAITMDVARLVADVEAVLGLADYLDRLAPGDKHYARLIRAAIENALDPK